MSLFLNTSAISIGKVRPLLPTILVEALGLLPHGESFPPLPVHSNGEPVRRHEVAARHLRRAVQPVPERDRPPLPGTVQVPSSRARRALAEPGRLHPPQPRSRRTSQHRIPCEVPMVELGPPSENQDASRLLRRGMDGLLRRSIGFQRRLDSL